jgi:hypothetical protein
MNRFNRVGWVLAFVSAMVAGCGGGGSAAPAAAPVAAPAPVVNTITGKFVDATVVGISYKCDGSTTVSGTTNAQGQFTCPEGKPVAFYVGDILVGRVSAPTAIVTPMDLVGAGATPATTAVSNIVRFLMSISSTNPTSGLLTIDPAVLTAAAGKTADFTAATATALDALIALVKPGATVYTNAQATTHVTASLNGLFAGNYGGTFAGSFGGTWAVTISSAGVVTGTATDTTGGVADVIGSMGTTLATGSNYAFTGTAGGAQWRGNLNLNTKVFSGTWSGGADSGTFTGTAR